MSNSSVTAASRIFKNFAALFVVGVFNKAMGLVIAVLVARFLGPESTGLFALLFGIAILIENTAVVGLQDTLVREVASHLDKAAALYRSALIIVILLSVVPALGFLVAASIVDQGEPTATSLLILAIGMPVATTFIISQAVLQGAERMQLLTWTTVTTRLASLIWLVHALYQGAGVEAAFLSRLFFQGSAIVVFIPVLLRGKMVPDVWTKPTKLAARSLPFALNRAVFDLSIRAPVLILPMLLGLARTGIFDAADRIRQAAAITVAAATVGIMPAFARHFTDPVESSQNLLGFSAKYTCLLISVVATAIAVTSGWIIDILYGDEFADAALPLQILVWAHVIIAVDIILKQAMLAGNFEYAVVPRAVVGLVVQILLIFVLGSIFDLVGVAFAILISAALVLAIDLRFVIAKLAAIEVDRFILKPLACPLLVGSVLLVIDDKDFAIRLLAATVIWLIVVVAFRLLPKKEIDFLFELSAFLKLRPRERPKAND